MSCPLPVAAVAAADPPGRKLVAGFFSTALKIGMADRNPCSRNRAHAELGRELPTQPHAVLGYDTNGDGRLDTFDTNQDGSVDVHAGGGELSVEVRTISHHDPLL